MNLCREVPVEIGGWRNGSHLLCEWQSLRVLTLCLLPLWVALASPLYVKRGAFPPGDPPPLHSAHSALPGQHMAQPFFHVHYPKGNDHAPSQAPWGSCPLPSLHCPGGVLAWWPQYCSVSCSPAPQVASGTEGVMDSPDIMWSLAEGSCLS